MHILEFQQDILLCTEKSGDLCVLIEYTFAVLLILTCRERLCQAPSTSPICSLCYREHNDFSTPLPSKINVEIFAWYA